MRIAEDVFIIGSGWLGASYSDEHDCNVYVRCGEDYLVIDSGVGCQPELLREHILADAIPSAGLRYLLLTHYHLDHAGGAHWVRENLGTEVCASAETAKALESGDETAISLTAAKKAGVYPRDFRFQACKVDRVFQGGEIWTVGDSSIEVLRTPGHSADMVSYLIRKPDRVMLFSGDTIFHGGEDPAIGPLRL